MAKYNTCQVCGQKEIPFFVVDDDIWKKTVLLDENVICPICIQTRLGRKLNVLDFPHLDQ